MNKSNYEKILAQYKSNYNDNGFHIYYDLKQTGNLLNISYRSMKYKVRNIYMKYKDTEMIYKSGRSYSISHKLFDEFQLRKRRKDRPPTVYNFGWTSNISWTTKDYYNAEYHIQLIERLNKINPEISYVGCIEADSNGRNHVHLLADEEPQHIKPKLAALLDEYLDDDRFYRLYCEKAINIGASVEYLKKYPQIKLNNTNLNF